MSAWLGAFHSAYLRAHGRSSEAQSRVRHWLDPLIVALDAELLGMLPVAFVPDSGLVPPPALGGDRSILAMAELARVWVEDMVPAEAAAEV